MYYIDSVGDDIVQSGLSASQAAITKCKVKKGIPKWTEMGKPAHDTAMCWHSIWLRCGKPNTGWVWEIRKRTWAQYHKIVKDLKKNDSLNRSEMMADAIIANGNRNFWREARKINPKKKTIPNTIDGVKGAKKISEMFADKHNGLYNSVPYDVDAMNKINECSAETT